MTRELNALTAALCLQAAAGSGTKLPAKIRKAGLTPLDAWDPEQMKRCGLPPLKSRMTPAQAEDILYRADRLGIRVITLWDEAYPPLLRQIYAPPAVLYLRGTVPDWTKQPAVAMVGTRFCSQEGLAVSGMLAQGLAAGGAIVVSGGAVGIDQAAHEGAMDAGGITVDVMPCSVEMRYPAKNAAMRQRIVETGGLLISEYPPGTPVTRGSFAVRNRLIAGICAATCVVEAPAVSGALITARLAADQGRDVFAVAGSLMDQRYEGSRALIRDGAEVLLDAAQVLACVAGRYTGQVDLQAAAMRQMTIQQMPPLPEEPAAPAPAEGPAEPAPCPADASAEAAQIYQILLKGPASLAQLTQQTGQDAGQLLVRLTELEIAGCIRTQPGPTYSVIQTGRNR